MGSENIVDDPIITATLSLTESARGHVGATQAKLYQFVAGSGAPKCK